ncbi:hypothetical protein Micbo1qcDRAFT_219857 [Microdochium bolleyi]|uniref:Hydrophobin n=1 Tax=Microdochium bolleyi TaxID=196109 RepID=A0A136IM61_9PEZI|nr:hypothetical protein Micbo1qcDRAFT_219857 [Microdochium bolleyi]
MFVRQSTVLACFAACVAAIDIRLYRGGGCGGDALNCANVSPGTCCTAVPQDPNFSVGMHAIPTEWNIVGLGLWQERCTGSVAGQDYSRGRRDICLGEQKYRSATYGFASKKRDESEGSSSSTVCQTPTQIIFEDGTLFDLSELSEDQYAEVVSDIRRWRKRS